MHKLKICAILGVVLNVALIVALLIVCLTLKRENKMAVMEMEIDDRENFQEIFLKTFKAVRYNFEEAEAEVEKVQSELYDLCEVGSATKPAAHLVISTVIPQSGKMQTLQWITSSNNSHTSDGITYDNGGIDVKHAGYYYIYSTIRYEGEGTEELDFGRILHNVLMKKESEMTESPTILMQNLQSTPTIRRGRQAYTTSTLGGSFFLQANTRVMVNSSLAGNIDTSPFGSYFGLFLM